MTMSRKVMVVLAALAVAIVAAPGGAREERAQGEAAEADDGQAAGVQRLPRASGGRDAGFDLGGSDANPTTGALVPVNVPAGGAEYFATHLKALGSENPDTYVVSAGDLIGGSPLLSGLFHDEPTIEFMNSVGLDTIGVGNHEFDEGKAELLRMQYGNRVYVGGGPNGGTSYTPARLDGCHPVDGCQDGTPFFGSAFQYLAANVTDKSTSNPLLPSYRIVSTSTGEKIAFIGETFKDTPLVVTPTGVAGLDFLDEADTVNALVRCCSSGRCRRSFCSCTRAASRTRPSRVASRTSTTARTSPAPSSSTSSTGSILQWTWS